MVEIIAARWIEIPSSDGGRFKGYLAIPEAGTGPGILILQEIFGVNRSIREIADYYAEEGYVALAPDLFWRIEPGLELGYGESDIQKAMSYLQRFDVDLFRKVLGPHYNLSSLWDRHTELEFATGIETAKKLVDETLPSNALMKRWAESAAPG